MNKYITVKKLVVISTLLLLVTSAVAHPITGAGNTHQNRLKIHSSITINGNNDFTCKNGVTSGSGTINDPYVISNWKIHSLANPGIGIRNTDAYFVIENCHIYGSKILSSIGISPLAGGVFSNVTNGKIVNCSCRNLKETFGIIIISSSNNTVENCYFKDNKFGLTVNGCPMGYKSSSSNNKIKNCEFFDCEDGIYFAGLPSSSNNIIDSCNCFDNNRGIVLDHLVHHTTIVGCNISNNKEVGVKIISGSSRNHISNNVFWKNKKHAEDNCMSEWDNGPIFGGNYWGGHDSSEPYDIPGAGNNKDYFPLNNPDENKKPVALFMYHPRCLIAGEETCFDALLSYDPDDNISLYEWDFGDGTNETGRKVGHTYTCDGAFNVTLNITSGTIKDSSVQTINIVERSEGSINVYNGMSIQEAVNNAKPGYTIYVGEGVYYENIVVNKPYISLIGNGSNNAIIDGCQNDNVIYVTSPGVTISGFTITNSSENKAGIQLGIPDYKIDAFDCHIKNNSILGNNIGINMSEIELSVIENNEVVNNEKYGMCLIRSFDNDIINNNLSSNNVGLGFYYGSNWNEIKNNTFMNNVKGVFLNWSHRNNITHNNIVDNIIGVEMNHAISTDINYNNIYDNERYGIIFNGKITDGTAPNAGHNWWGSKMGPSWILPIFGDRVIGVKETGKINLMSGIALFNICRPCAKNPIGL